MTVFACTYDRIALTSNKKGGIELNLPIQNEYDDDDASFG